MTEQQQLQDQLERLRRRIAAAPYRSFTAAQARDLIAFVTSPDCPLDLSEKLATIRDANRTFSDGIQYSDPIRYGPDTWKRGPELIQGGRIARERPQEATLTGLKPGDREALKRELWAAVRAASALLDHDNADIRLRAVHATAQAGNVYRATITESELEAMIADLERRAEKANL